MSITLLIAEDDFIVRMTTAEYLRDAGFQVIEAANADEALDILKSGQSVDLLFTDVRMPGSMDGCELAKRVRAAWPTTHIILTSGYSDELLTARSVSEDFVVPKPYRPHAILTKIRTVIGPNSCPA